VHCREVDLFDGTRLIPASAYDSLLAEGALTGNRTGFVTFASVFMTPSRIGCYVVPVSTASSDRVLRVHPSFRVVALALPPQPTKSWIHPEVLGMFAFHLVPSLPLSEAYELLQHKFPSLSFPAVDAIVKVSEQLHRTAESTFRDDLPSSTAMKLSLRQLLRVARHATASSPPGLSTLTPDLSAAIADSIKESMLLQFLPDIVRRSVQNILETVLPLYRGSSSDTSESPVVSFKPVVSEGVLDIGGVQCPVALPQQPELVPAPLFFDIPRHSKLLRDMLLDVVGGDHHLLLIGNQVRPEIPFPSLACERLEPPQGVGKNKLADRALQLLNIEREYMQLHRDSTVQSLTLAPTLRGGVVVWEDSALVRAVTHGRTLVVDEIDKAPLEVVAVLKSLLLADGRRLLGQTRLAMEGGPSAGIVNIHPNFRLWALANRPGYPFLGNNFFRYVVRFGRDGCAFDSRLHSCLSFLCFSECGDVFSSHVRAQLFCPVRF
jgi:von Willebrand factor A domain-containing protein 8